MIQKNSPKCLTNRVYCAMWFGGYGCLSRYGDMWFGEMITKPVKYGLFSTLFKQLIHSLCITLYNSKINISKHRSKTYPK